MTLFSDTMILDEIARDSMSTLNRLSDDIRAFLISATNTNINQELRSLRNVRMLGR